MPGEAKQTPKKRVLIAFQCVQEKLPDGRFIITPLRVEDDRDVSAKVAAKHLGLADLETIYMLCEIGEPAGLSAWRLPSARGNSAWRISWRSVLGFRDRNRNRTD